MKLKKTARRRDLVVNPNGGIFGIKRNDDTSGFCLPSRFAYKPQKYRIYELLFMKCPHIESAYTQQYTKYFTKHIMVMKSICFKTKWN